MDVYVKPFSECSTYQQESGPNIEYRSLLPTGMVADLGIGLVSLKGPTATGSDRHTHCEQVYLIIQGSGTVKLGEQAFKIEAPTIVHIPFNTDHSVELADGESMQYIFVNQFLSTKENL